MSEPIRRRTPFGDELISLAHPEPVNLEQVETELASLWRTATESVHAEEPGVTRACLWNLVAYHARQPGAASAIGELHPHQQLLWEVTMAVPSRVIHLDAWNEADKPQGGREVEAWISTNCLQDRHEGIVCGEEINLVGYGPSGHSHFPALVRALLQPQLPVALLWLEEMPRRGRLLGQLVRQAERLLVDCRTSGETDFLPAVQEVTRELPVRVNDLGWLWLEPLRHLLAELFDPPGRAEQLGHLERVHVRVAAPHRNAALLLLGWLLARCGITQYKAVDLGAEQRSSRWNMRQAGRSVSVHLRVEEAAPEAPGAACLPAVEVQAGGDTFAVRGVDAEHVAVSSPDRDLPNFRIRPQSAADLIVTALNSRQADPVFSEALDAAVALAESEQWQQ